MSTEKSAINTQQYQGYQEHVYPAPVGGQPVGQTVVVVEERDDFVPACMGTGFCGFVGLCFFGCCCNTPTGRVGAATGCFFNASIAFILCFVLLIISAKYCSGSGSDSGVCKLPMMKSLGILFANLFVACLFVVLANAIRKTYVVKLQLRKGQRGLVV